jgi:hypothetical protein
VLHSSLGNIVLCGDFNSRTSNKQETHDISVSLTSSEIDDEVTDIITNKKFMFFNRTSEDKCCNTQGELFMEMLNAASLYI